MPCEAFEGRLIGYSELPGAERAEVDAHLATCPGCSTFLETFLALDQSLTALYSFGEPKRAFDPALVKQPSAIPEVLDFVGWAAVAAIVIILGMVAAERFEYMLSASAGL